MPRRRRIPSVKPSGGARRPAGGGKPKGAPAGNRREVHPAVVGQSDATAAAPSAPPPDIPVVAIGASAGGLEAFKRFMGAMPADGGIAFALIPHLDPNHARDRKSTRLNSSHSQISYAVFCLKKKNSNRNI